MAELQTLNDLLTAGREKCRALEQQINTDPLVFKYTARTFWWDFCQNAQHLMDRVMHFREFWDNEDTYPRTIA